jgi:hypothetical protein
MLESACVHAFSVSHNIAFGIQKANTLCFPTDQPLACFTLGSKWRDGAYFTPVYHCFLSIGIPYIELNSETHGLPCLI